MSQSAVVFAWFKRAYLEEADCNRDGVVDFADISSFIEILSGATGP